ncbi:MAG: SMC-Scp complex subunit ScpB [Omnitrophica WOR_2 bacterium RIFCSPHIGHO2_01_FULL_48_9]|nr:MAG: SMC-Scp complex subunit ScpB [Omnitrophica WOR_2 bacterium RIFCSPHIGHO2_02_FULL_48_11]OGX32059.1 MAG: SMC-Scp complex subunit ScpB [Omnitrophica WOR_2 bacterium RIFCSPHIGHO2_01_FULL_48_9]
MDQSSIEHVKGIVEALLFVNEKPVTLQQIKEVAEGVTAGELKQIIQSLKDELEQKKTGMLIVEIADGYQMLTNPLYAAYVRSFYKTRHKERLSKPALETLAIIAYKQPVTRADVEVIRGVNSDGVMVHLLNKELIKAIGRKDIPGRPFLYGSTKQFLEYFGLKSLLDLPKLEDFPSLQPAQAQAQADSAVAAVVEQPVAAPAQAVPDQAPAVVEVAEQPAQPIDASSRLDELEKENRDDLPLMGEPNLKEAMEEISQEENPSAPEDEPGESRLTDILEKESELSSDQDKT